MKVGDDFRLALEPGEAFNFRFEANPNFKADLTPQQIMIFTSQNRDVAAQIRHFTKQGTSAHIIIGKDGREIVQLCDLNRAATQKLGFDNTSLAVTLDYPGALTEQPNFFHSVSKFDPSQVLQATPVHGSRTRPWALFPKVQLDALLVVMKALLDRFEPIKSIMVHDEMVPGHIDPGPTFPRTLFREKLLRGRGDLKTLEETNQETVLRAGPGPQHRTLFSGPLPKGTDVSILTEQDDWALVEAVTEIDGNPWVVGWMEERFLSAKIYVPVVKDHMLYTQDGRRYTYIPAHETNYEIKTTMQPPDPKYVIMHFTTGTQMSSTINWFTKPHTASTHLLIGRDGRVIQFVPFNKPAHHVGFSFWEGERNLNKNTIGIELDNAGYLRKQNGKWMRKKSFIPTEQVIEKPHWKERVSRGWEAFPEVQLKAALEVVKALVKHYNIQDILGHDMVNLINRSDPGPLFPIEDWWQEIYKRREPAVRAHVIADASGAAVIYADQGDRPPKLPHPTFVGKLPAGSGVKVLETQGSWVLVRVVTSSKGGFTNKIGWIPAATLRKTSVGDKTTVEQVLFIKHATVPSPPPPVELKGSPVPNGTRVRILDKEPGWTRVFVFPDPEKKIRWMDGWVNSESVQPAGMTVP